MTLELAELQRVVPQARSAVSKLAELLHELCAGRANALTVFGAALDASFQPTRHNIQSVLVLEQIDLEVLRQLAQHGPELGSHALAAPLIMTPDYIRSSLDTFPLELIEIHQQHETVFGPDHFKDLRFEDEHVRLQCERELKSILIGMRQGLLAAAGRDQLLSALEAGAAERLLRTIRGMLWFKGTRTPQPASEVLKAVERLIERELPAIHRVLEAAEPAGWQEFKTLYHDVATLREIADAW